jgi:CRISPR/Cas system-associated exonuclease Cas4 (RecB family)
MPDVIELHILDDQTVIKKQYIYDPKPNKFREKVIKRTSTKEALDDFYRITEIIREQPPIYNGI